MEDGEFEFTLTIPEHNNEPSTPAAIGLADLVSQTRADNPFDLGQALGRAAGANAARADSSFDSGPALARAASASADYGN